MSKKRDNHDNPHQQEINKQRKKAGATASDDKSYTVTQQKQRRKAPNNQSNRNTPQNHSNQDKRSEQGASGGHSHGIHQSQKKKNSTKPSQLHPQDRATSSRQSQKEGSVSTNATSTMNKEIDPYTVVIPLSTHYNLTSQLKSGDLRAYSLPSALETPQGGNQPPSSPSPPSLDNNRKHGHTSQIFYAATPLISSPATTILALFPQLAQVLQLIVANPQLLFCKSPLCVNIQRAYADASDSIGHPDPGPSPLGASCLSLSFLTHVLPPVGSDSGAVHDAKHTQQSRTFKHSLSLSDVVLQYFQHFYTPRSHRTPSLPVADSFPPHHSRPTDHLTPQLLSALFSSAMMVPRQTPSFSSRFFSYLVSSLNPTTAQRFRSPTALYQASSLASIYRGSTPLLMETGSTPFDHLQRFHEGYAFQQATMYQLFTVLVAIVDSTSRTSLRGGADVASPPAAQLQHSTTEGHRDKTNNTKKKEDKKRKIHESQPEVAQRLPEGTMHLDSITAAVPPTFLQTNLLPLSLIPALPRPPSIRGLRNINNNCYINSIIQALLSVPSIGQVLCHYLPLVSGDTAPSGVVDSLAPHQRSYRVSADLLLQHTPAILTQQQRFQSPSFVPPNFPDIRTRLAMDGVAVTQLPVSSSLKPSPAQSQPQYWWNVIHNPHHPLTHRFNNLFSSENAIAVQHYANAGCISHHHQHQYQYSYQHPHADVLPSSNMIAPPPATSSQVPSQDNPRTNMKPCPQTNTSDKTLCNQQEQVFSPHPMLTCSRLIHYIANIGQDIYSSPWAKVNRLRGLIPPSTSTSASTSPSSLLSSSSISNKNEPTPSPSAFPRVFLDMMSNLSMYTMSPTLQTPPSSSPSPSSVRPPPHNSYHNNNNNNISLLSRQQTATASTIKSSHPVGLPFHALRERFSKDIGEHHDAAELLTCLLDTINTEFHSYVQQYVTTAGHADARQYVSWYDRLQALEEEKHAVVSQLREQLLGSSPLPNDAIQDPSDSGAESQRPHTHAGSSIQALGDQLDIISSQEATLARDIREVFQSSIPFAEEPCNCGRHDAFHRYPNQYQASELGGVVAPQHQHGSLHQQQHQHHHHQHLFSNTLSDGVPQFPSHRTCLPITYEIFLVFYNHMIQMLAILVMKCSTISRQQQQQQQQQQQRRQQQQQQQQGGSLHTDTLAQSHPVMSLLSSTFTRFFCTLFSHIDHIILQLCDELMAQGVSTTSYKTFTTALHADESSRRQQPQGRKKATAQRQKQQQQQNKQQQQQQGQGQNHHDAVEITAVKGDPPPAASMPPFSPDAHHDHRITPTYTPSKELSAIIQHTRSAHTFIPCLAACLRECRSQSSSQVVERFVSSLATVFSEKSSALFRDCASLLCDEQPSSTDNSGTNHCLNSTPVNKPHIATIAATVTTDCFVPPPSENIAELMDRHPIIQPLSFITPPNSQNSRPTGGSQHGGSSQHSEEMVVSDQGWYQVGGKAQSQSGSSSSTASSSSTVKIREDLSLAQQSWITELFQSKLKSTLTKPRSTSLSYQPVLMLSLPVPKQGDSLVSCYHRFMEKSYIDDVLDGTARCTATSQTVLETPSPCLVIQYNRFIGDIYGRTTKVDTTVPIAPVLHISTSAHPHPNPSGSASAKASGARHPVQIKEITMTQLQKLVPKQEPSQLQPQPQGKSRADGTQDKLPSRDANTLHSSAEWDELSKYVSRQVSGTGPSTTQDDAETSSFYTLTAVVVHHGSSIDHGHYTTYVRCASPPATVTVKSPVGTKVDTSKKDSTAAENTAHPTGLPSFPRDYHGPHQFLWSHMQTLPPQSSSHACGVQQRQGQCPQPSDQDPNRDPDDDDDEDSTDSNLPPQRKDQATHLRYRSIARELYCQAHASWVHCDDQHIDTVPWRSVEQSPGYLLFYSKL